MTHVELDYFGKSAAKDYLQKNTPLNESIVKVAQAYSLNKDQIDRVVESANTHTYLALFNKSDDKYIKFPVAESEKIAEALDVPLVSENSTKSDYAEPPKRDFPDISIFPVEEPEKTAEVVNEYSGEKLKLYQRTQFANKYFLEKIAEADDLFKVEAEKLYRLVKQEVLGGEKFGYIKQAMLEQHPIKLTEIMTSEMKNRLSKEDRLLDLNDQEKTAELFDQEHRVLKQTDRLVKIAEEALNWREKYATFAEILGETASNILKGVKASTEFAKKHKGLLAGTVAAGVAANVGYNVGKKKTEIELSQLNNVPRKYQRR